MPVLNDSTVTDFSSKQKDGASGHNITVHIGKNIGKAVAFPFSST